MLLIRWLGNCVCISIESCAVPSFARRSPSIVITINASSTLRWIFSVGFHLFLLVFHFFCILLLLMLTSRKVKRFLLYFKLERYRHIVYKIYSNCEKKKKYALSYMVDSIRNACWCQLYSKFFFSLRKKHTKCEQFQWKWSSWSDISVGSVQLFLLVRSRMIQVAHIGSYCENMKDWRSFGINISQGYSWDR